MINRIAYEPYSLGNLYGIAPLMLSLNVITFIIGFCVLLYSCGGFNTRRFSAMLCVGVVDLNWQLLIIISVFIPLVYIAGNSVKKNIMKYSKARSLVLEDFVLRLTEALKGFTDIKIFRVENKINKTLKELSNNMLKNEKAQLFYNRLYLDITGLLSAALPPLSLVAGFLLMQYGKTTLGVVISFYMYVGNYVEPVTNIADLHSMVIDANEKKKLIDEVKQDFAVDLSGNEICEDFTGIKLQDIKHKFENKDINIETSVNINMPGFYGISAPSGLGKSTALKILSGLLYSDTANVSIGGKQIKNFDTNSLNGKIFYLSAASFIFKGTVKEDIELSAASYITEETFNSIFDKSDNISLQTNLETEGVNVSLGQKQRIVLLRLLALEEEPKIIILDEALSGLDEKRETAAIEILKKTFKNTIILFATHRKKSFDFCDKVFEFKSC